MIPRLTADDYHRALRRLAPRGKLWSAVLGTRFDNWLAAAAVELARVHNRFVDVVDDEAFPETASETLAAWEDAVGLPDDCVVAVPATEAERQSLVTSRWLATGGGPPAYYVQVAADLGFAVTITESPYEPFRCGSGRCGESMNPAGAAFYWRVNASASLTSDERALLECEFNRLKPAHTIAEFVYS